MNTSKLRELMWNKRITQKSLAELTEIDEGTLSRILSGQRNCSLSKAQKIAKVMKLNNKQIIEIFMKGE